MNELINVTLNDSHEPVVSGRQLHEALGVKTEYRKWFGRMAEYGFEENQDFARVTQKCPTPGGLKDMTDHIIKNKECTNESYRKGLKYEVCSTYSETLMRITHL